MYFTDITDPLIGRKKLELLRSEDRTRLRLIAIMLLTAVMVASPAVAVFWYSGNSPLALLSAMGLLTLVLQLGMLSTLSPNTCKHVFAASFPVFFILNIFFTGTYEVVAMLSIPFVTLSIFLFRRSAIRHFYVMYYIMAVAWGLLLKEVTIPLYVVEQSDTIHMGTLLVTFVLQIVFSSFYLTELNKQEKEINTSQKRLNRAQHQAKIGSFHHRFNSNYVSVSDEFRKMFSDVDESKGMVGLLSLFPPEVGFELSQFVENGFNGDKFSLQFECGQRSNRWMNMTVTLLGPEKYKPTNITGTLQDISELTDAKMALKQSESKFRAIFEQAPFPLLLSDEQGIIDCNRAAVDFLGVNDKREIEGTSTSDWSPECQPNGSHSLAESIRVEALARQKGAYRFEWLFQSKKEILIPSEVTLCPITIGTKEFTFVLWTDLTERKAHEAQIRGLLQSLKNQNIVLEEKVKARTASLESSNLELQRSNQDLEQFAYAASHDLQEPLRMVGSFVQLLEHEYRDILGESGKQYIEFAVDGVKRMSGLIRALLDYSRVGRDEIKVKTTDMTQLVQSRISDLSKQIEEARAVVTITSMPSEMDVESAMLGMVFQNLVSNAIKFNRCEKPTVEICAFEEKERWRFEIKDNGIGIEKGNEEKVFQIFQRLHRKEEFKGTGIGLAMCRKVVDRHGGSIWYDSAPGSGTIFKFTISKNLQESCKVTQAKYSKSY